MTNFTAIEDHDNNLSLINLDQIRLITDIRDGHCRIIFDNNFTIELHGDGADKLVARLTAESNQVDGTPIAAMLERFKESEQSSPSRVIPFDGSESES